MLARLRPICMVILLSLSCATFTGQARINELFEAAQSEDRGTRENAITALLQMRGRAPEERLRRLLLESPPAIRASLLDAIARAKDDRFSKEVVEALGDSDESVRLQARSATLALGSRSGGSDRLIEALSQVAGDRARPPSLRARAIREFFPTGSREQVKLLISLLDDPDPAIHKAALDNLREITALDNPDEVSVWQSWWEAERKLSEEEWLRKQNLRLRERLNTMQVRLEAAETELARSIISSLERRPDRLDSEPLLSVLSGTPLKVRLYTIKELGTMKAPKAKEHFRNLLSDPEDSIRAASAEALGLLGERTVGPDLLPALGDSSPAVRAAAVESLGKLEAKEYAHEILLRLDDPDDSVKAAAAEALGRLRDADALPPLARLIGYPNPLVREKAVQALGSFSGPLAVDSLLGALSDKNDRVRWYAVASLGKIGDPKSRAELIKTLSDEKAALREAAAEALAKVGDESTLPLLESTMSDADSRVAEKAKWAFLELASSNSQLLRREAERLLEKKAYDLARVLYERLLEKYSTSEPELKPDALWKLARIDFEAGKEQEAAERFEDLVNSYPARLDIKREYAHLLSLMGRLGRSASLYTQLAKDEPEWRAEYLEQTFEAVEALFNSGDFSEVLRAIEEVEKAAPDFGGEVLAGKFSELRKKASASSKENESGQEKASPLKDTEVPRSNSSPEAASKIPPPSDSSSRKD